MAPAPAWAGCCWPRSPRSCWWPPYARQLRRRPRRGGRCAGGGAHVRPASRRRGAGPDDAPGVRPAGLRPRRRHAGRRRSSSRGSWRTTPRRVPARPLPDRLLRRRRRAGRRPGGRRRGQPLRDAWVTVTGSLRPGGEDDDGDIPVLRPPAWSRSPPDDPYGDAGPRPGRSSLGVASTGVAGASSKSAGSTTRLAGADEVEAIALRAERRALAVGHCEPGCARGEGEDADPDVGAEACDPAGGVDS